MEDDISVLGDGIVKLFLDQIDDYFIEVFLFDEEEEEEKVLELKMSKYVYFESVNFVEENGKVYKISIMLKF